MFKNISHDVFVQNADRLEAWARSPTAEVPLIDILREAIELKKLNTNLMKATPIEDFIADAYAYLYQRNVPDLLAKSHEEENRGRMRVDHLMNAEHPALNTPSPDPSTRAEDTAPARTRIRGVGRREIQKRAEALVNRPAISNAPIKILKSPTIVNEASPPRSSVQALINQNDPNKEGSSLPGSVRDSADDESELSDIDDVVEAPSTHVLFPNLTRNTEEPDDGEKGGSDQGGGDSVEAEEPEEREEVEGPEEPEEPEEEQGEGEGEETYHTPMEE